MSIPSTLVNDLDQHGGRYDVFPHAHSRTIPDTAGSATASSARLRRCIRASTNCSAEGRKSCRMNPD